MLKRYTVSFLNNQQRGICVYLPRDYGSSGLSYPTLYMHDGLNVFRDEDAIGGVSLGLERYMDEHGLKLIVVAIDSDLEQRVNEYCPWVYGDFSKKFIGDAPRAGGMGKNYVDAIVNSLKPLIDETYCTIQNQTYMAGISLGGLITTFSACQYPQIFKRVAALSSAFWANQEEIEEFIRSSDISSIEKFYMDCGTFEAGERMSEVFASSNKAVYEILRHKVSNTRFEVVENAHHVYSDFSRRFSNVLTYLMS